MRKTIAAVLLGLLVVGCSSGGGGLMSGGVKKYTLEMNPKPGQTFGYNMTMATKGGPQAMTMVMNFTTTAEKVESDKITMQTQFGDMVLNGKPVPGGAAALKTPIEQILDKHGKLISQTGGPPGMTQTASASSNLPDHSISIGDTWAIDFQGVKATSKLVSVDNEGGKEIANIETTIAPNDKMKADKPFTSKIDVATGMLISADMSGMQVNGATMDMSIKQTN